MKTNYHTHTTRCHHATGSDEDYVKSAIKGGLHTLGFSDHTPWHYRTDYVAHMRMLPADLPDYVESLRDLRGKYKDQIDIKIGLECEYFPNYLPWLKEQVAEYGLDYLIFGNHFYHTDETFPYFGSHTDSRDMLDLYEESAIEGMETGLFCCLAHPDLFMRSYPRFDQPLHHHQPPHLPGRRTAQHPLGVQPQLHGLLRPEGACPLPLPRVLAHCHQRGLHGHHRLRCPRQCRL